MSDTDTLPGLDDRDRAAADDLPAALDAAAPRRWWNRTSLVLLAVALLAGGFLGGVRAQQHWGKTTTTATTTTRTGLGTGFGGGFPGGGASGGPGGNRGTNTGTAPTATAGTLTSVAAGMLIVQTTAGATIKVKIADGTTILQSTTLAKLTAGRSIVVQGSIGADGTITATTVTAF